MTPPRSSADDWYLCPDCRLGMVGPLAVPGRSATFRGRLVEVPPDFKIPTCRNCHAEFLDPESARALDLALEAAFWSQGT